MISVFPDLHCVGANGYCFKNSPCTQDMTRIQFSLGARHEAFDMGANRFMIPGTEVGDNADTCYFAFFRQDIASDENWYFGNIFMQKYYTIYDASTIDNGYIQLALGIAAPQKPRPQNPSDNQSDDQSNVIERNSQSVQSKTERSIASLMKSNQVLLWIVAVISVCCLICVCVCCYRTI